ncbi:ABC-type proline/glycine betaine transport system permease subunit [Virgibacillus natechei]|uniref:ABC-type proline/glycine betaine transport system permease subunit n=1 Tax=Virgibacillus natechei TaxID=1216297 RepID=A0ABS4IDG3_9BACI|nr:proline/glycine betaine ABC transporter permease [Virgibacillus natechei]MBP1968982.1 ABC-type proline/glycine betaine transport system permease subunit [Virgibacillus natechei]UZD14259.1 proline/glycine betaine ABC transporter permease [Virgibacillus natechei]
MNDAEGTLFPKLPLAEWVEAFVDFLTASFGAVFDAITAVIGFITENFVVVLELVPPILLIVVVALLAWWVVSYKLGLFALIGLGLINNLGYWPETLETVALVIVSVVASMIIGIPVGIWMSQKKSVETVITPILDFMQTMPAFVYLIPAVVFFSLGMVPGVVATIIFSMPPTVRLTNLGIRQVDQELIEASNAFGSSTGQRLGKVQIPLATPSIMAGINQTIMLSLSMVVIASMVGAPGLGTVVYRAVTQVAIGPGFEGGLSLVIVAMLLDRITKGAVKN